MNNRNIQIIESYLQREEVQKRILENMLRRRSEVTVTIGRAADLFGFTENQLRDWEERGLLNPQRSTKQRQYTLTDLDKLAIIRELMDANYTPGDIPSEIDSIWKSISKEQKDQSLSNRGNKVDDLPINVRIENVRAELFW